METGPKFRKRKKTSSSCVYVLHKTSYQEISRPSRAVTANKCTKKCNARAELLFWLLSLLLFLTFSLPSPSSLLKLPNGGPRGLPRRRGISFSRREAIRASCHTTTSSFLDDFFKPDCFPTSFPGSLLFPTLGMGREEILRTRLSAFIRC